MITLLAWLATYWIHSSLLLGAVALLTAFWVRREAWRETLWKAAIVGGALTTLLQLSLGIRPLVGRWELPVEMLAPQRGASTWPTVLVVAVAVIAGWKVARVLRRPRRVRRLLRERVEIADPLTSSMLRNARHQTGVLRPVRLTSAPRTSTPFTLGTSEICLPDRFFDGLGVDERRCVIAHELAHLARRDPHWQLVTALIESVFFFQPLNRLAARRIRESAEYLADDWAVGQTHSAVSLARSLAVVASWRSAESREMPRPLMALVEEGSPLLGRVERLRERRPEPALGVGARILATAALLAMTIGTAPGITTRATTRELGARQAGTARGDVRVLDAADLGRPLAARFAAALREGVRRGNRDLWIAYESRAALPPIRKHETDGSGGLVLHSTRDRTWDEGAPDLVVLVRVHANSSNTFSVSRVAGDTPNVEVDPGRLPVYWLAAAEVRESIGFLASLGPNAAEGEVSEMLIDVIRVHRDSAVVVPFVSRALADGHARSIRAKRKVRIERRPARIPNP